MRASCGGLRSTAAAMNVHLWSPGFTGFGGGITAFSRELALAMIGLGHALRLVGKVDESCTWHGQPLLGAGSMPGPLVTPAFAAGALMSGLWHRPQRIVSTHLNFGPVAHAAKRFANIPYMLVAHGIDVDRNLSKARLDALRAATRVIAVSQWTRRRLLELTGVDDSRIAVLANTFDDTRFGVAARPDCLVERYRLAPGERVVLTVARLDPAERYKGYDKIVEALPAIRAACGGVRFIVAGRGSDRGRIERLAQDVGVEDAVTFAGFVKDEELADHYRLADVFAMPSTGEGFGIVFLEAMACGTPVLAGDADGSVDALDEGRLGRLVPPGSVEAIAAGIVSLLERRGPAWWFDRSALSDAVRRRFGRGVFQERVGTILGA